MPDRFPQPLGRKGSLKWMQAMVNDHPLQLSAVVGASINAPPDAIQWVSPMVGDDYAEYRDQGFLDRLGVSLGRYPIKDFWPARGPQWDALGRVGDRVILVEAKAHLAELKSSPSQAGPASMDRIRASLGLVKSSLGVASAVDWTGLYYQYANRLAHLYLLCQLNHIPAELVHLCFLNDRDINGPASAEEWQVGFEQAEAVLGIQDHPLLRHVHHVFVDVTDLGGCNGMPVRGEMTYNP
jgi:hypothetical protein